MKTFFKKNIFRGWVKIDSFDYKKTLPLWCFENEAILKHIKLDTFPIEAKVYVTNYFVAKIFRVTSYLQEIKSTIYTIDRNNPNYKINIFATHNVFWFDKIMSRVRIALRSALEHEVDENLQFEINGIKIIPFDPHKK